MRWYVGFSDPVPLPGREPTLFEWAGGLPALTRVTRLLYEKHVPADPLLAPLFANMPPGHPRWEAMWLAEVFGGPACYSQDCGGYPQMAAAHADHQLTQEQRARWVALVGLAADEAGLPADAEFRSAFTAYIEWGSRAAAGLSQPGAAQPHDMPMPRWDWSAAGPPDTTAAVAADGHAGAQAVLPGPGEAVSFAAHISRSSASATGSR